ncbi:hypothetical protein [Peterkaempfera griseoplana]|uniref:hypothetical protein n=1 Tax=Peterkaempfera griseoplana TaxID=66896 RepID=UPI0006E1AE74|nr:hypothetical protein [Peterkaempfera griseoplana]
MRPIIVSLSAAAAGAGAAPVATAFLAVFLAAVFFAVVFLAVTFGSAVRFPAGASPTCSPAFLTVFFATLAADFFAGFSTVFAGPASAGPASAGPAPRAAAARPPTGSAGTASWAEACWAGTGAGASAARAARIGWVCGARPGAAGPGVPEAGVGVDGVRFSSCMAKLLPAIGGSSPAGGVHRPDWHVRNWAASPGEYRED